MTGGAAGLSVAVGIGPAAAGCGGAVVHFHGHADVVEQCGDGIHFGSGAGGGQLCGHGAPVVAGVEIGAKGSIGAVDEGVRAVAGVGVRPIPHQLACGGGHASRHGAEVLGAVERAQAVIEGLLVPGGGYQRRHWGVAGRCGQAARHETLPLLPYRAAGRGCCDAAGVLCVAVEADLVLVAVKPLAQIGGHSLGDERPGCRIAEDGRYAVVARHKHKAAAVGSCKDVEFAVACLCGDVCKSVDFNSVCLQEIVGGLSGLSGIYRRCCHLQRCR